jgi:hypothetical protein
LVIPNRYSYEGGFENGVFEGCGTYTTPDGVKYQGMFRDGKANGYGTKYSPSGDILAKGFWENDQPVSML